MASTPLLHALLLLLARLFLVHVIGAYILKFIIVFINHPTIIKSTSTKHPECGNEHGLKVIACGFSRSGTMSLQLALQRLGFDPCYHGKNIVDSPRDAELWLKAATGKVDDWSLILGGYKAIASFPAACFYRELMVAYPKAKVILNIRDPEQWYESFSRTVYKMYSGLLIQMFRPNYWKFMDVAFMKGQFKGRFGDKEFTIGVYKKHIEEVKRVVPKEKLLVYKVQDGWIPLCTFLEVERPQGTPFPRVNDSSSFFHKVLDKQLMGLCLALAIYVVLISLLVVVALKCITS